MRLGNIFSALLAPPPIVDAASITVTWKPARASFAAAASPLGPLPTTMAVDTERFTFISARRCPGEQRLVLRSLVLPT